MVVVDLDRGCHMVRPARKIEFEELFNSTTMFYVNEHYEEDMEREVRRKVDELAAELNSINTKEGLKAYIVEHKWKYLRRDLKEWYP